MFLINVTEYYERKFHIKYTFFLTIIKICSFKIFSMKFCNKCNHAKLNLKNGREWINYTSKKKLDIRSGEHESHRVSTIDRFKENLRKFLI